MALDILLSLFLWEDVAPVVSIRWCITVTGEGLGAGGHFFSFSVFFIFSFSVFFKKT